MTLKSCLTFWVPVLFGVTSVAAYADTYSQTTIETAPGVVTETETVEPAPMVIREGSTTVIREQPTTVIREQPIINQPVIEKEKIVVKKGSHHLIKVGPVKVF